ncbi:SDR family NAD(P)-dependent oxidoreductase [Patescibacteria group bacterium]|nr:SDR family NAD(P)-dependent oxidoreductase [Patescibacteria group bacterium]
MLLNDKVVFITGGTSGIGKATVLVALREGAKVIFTGRKKEEADALGGEAIKAGYDIDNLLFIAGDVTDQDALHDAIEEGVKHFGKLDCVFANAGRHMVGSILETTLEQRREMFAVDVE